MAIPLDRGLTAERGIPREAFDMFGSCADLPEGMDMKGVEVLE
jgi:hypothetical protein